MTSLRGAETSASECAKEIQMRGAAERWAGLWSPAQGHACADRQRARRSRLRFPTWQTLWSSPLMAADDVQSRHLEDQLCVVSLYDQLGHEESPARFYDPLW